MDDETHPVSAGSGSRWEPADDGPLPGSAPATPVPPAVPPAVPPLPPGAAVATPPSRQRLALAGGALAALLVGGAGGFELGNATANGDTPDPQQRSGFGQAPGEGFDGDHHGPLGGPGGVPGPGRLPQGQLPQGTTPPPDESQSDPSGATGGEGASRT